MNGSQVEAWPCASVAVALYAKVPFGKLAGMTQIAVQKKSVGLAAGMRAVMRIHLLAVGHFDDQALEARCIEGLSVLIANAEPKDDLFQVLELVVENTERTGRAGLGAAHHVALEEQLGLCHAGKSKNGTG